jgi:hypothetical protein
VRLDFPQWRYVTRVGVIPGYVHTYPGYGDLFTVNNRLTAATLSFSNDEERDVTFEESKAMQYTDFDPPIYTNHVKLTIKGCRRGTYAKWNDTCISEMEVWGYDSQRGDQS